MATPARQSRRLSLKEPETPRTLDLPGVTPSRQSRRLSMKKPEFSPEFLDKAKTVRRSSRKSAVTIETPVTVKRKQGKPPASSAKKNTVEDVLLPSVAAAVAAIEKENKTPLKSTSKKNVDDSLRKSVLKECSATPKSVLKLDSSSCSSVLKSNKTPATRRKNVMALSARRVSFSIDPDELKSIEADDDEAAALSNDEEQEEEELRVVADVVAPVADELKRALLELPLTAIAFLGLAVVVAVGLAVFWSPGALHEQREVSFKATPIKAGLIQDALDLATSATARIMSGKRQQRS